MEYNLQKIIRDIALGINFKALEVNVPIIFSGMQGFPLRRSNPHDAPTVSL